MRISACGRVSMCRFVYMVCACICACDAWRVRVHRVFVCRNVCVCIMCA